MTAAKDPIAKWAKYHATMAAKREAYALAKRIGATLEYRRTGSAKHVDIVFAEGTAFDGNEGLDALHHECELDEDIWPGVVADLRVAT